eukprot:scaffold100587_cov33-Phaeocystis_antarctica.AAC.1
MDPTSRASPLPPSRPSHPQLPERQPAHAARRPHRANADVSTPGSTAALPAAWGRQGQGAGGR